MSDFGSCPKQYILDEIRYYQKEYDISKIELMAILGEIIAHIGENFDG